MADQATIEAVVFIAGVVGTFAATMIPYWSKIRENPETAFEKKFLGTAVVSFITSVVIGVGLFPSLMASVDVTGASIAGIFAITALAAFGLNRGANMAMPGPAELVPPAAATETTTTTTTNP